MFKLYSKGCEYAMRALIFAAQRDDGQGSRFQIGEVCEKLDIPESFTRKIFQALVQGGFLQAMRGPGGGYQLNRPPSEIPLIEIIEAVDGADTFNHCVMGLPECNGKKPCPLHEVWSSTKNTLLEHLGKKTLQDVLGNDKTNRNKSSAKSKAKPASRTLGGKTSNDAAQRKPAKAASKRKSKPASGAK